MQNSLKMSNTILCYGIIFYIFMSIFWPSQILLWTLILGTCDIAYLFLNKEFKLTINITIFLWILFIIISVLGLIVIDFEASYLNSTGELYYVLTLIMVLINYILLISDLGWEEVIVKMIVKMSLIFVLGSLIQLFLPEVLIRINSLRLTNIKQIEALSFIRLERLVGFTTNTGINSFAMIPALIHFFIKILNSKEKSTKIINVILFALVFALLIMTGKRSFFLFVFVILFYLFMSYSKRKIFSFFPAVILSVTLFLIIINTEMGQFMLQKTLGQEDITTGRLPGYYLMWNDFLANPLIGKGTYTTDSVLNITNGHNIYLQILRENGILGFLPFTILLIVNLFATNNLLKKTGDLNAKYLVGMSSALQILFILWGVTENPLYDRYPLMLYFIAIAVFWNMKKMNKETNLQKHDLIVNRSLEYE